MACPGGIGKAGGRDGYGGSVYGGGRGDGVLLGLGSGNVRGGQTGTSDKLPRTGHANLLCGG